MLWCQTEYLLFDRVFRRSHLNYLPVRTGFKSSCGATVDDHMTRRLERIYYLKWKHWADAFCIMHLWFVQTVAVETIGKTYLVTA